MPSGKNRNTQWKRYIIVIFSSFVFIFILPVCSKINHVPEIEAKSESELLKEIESLKKKIENAKQQANTLSREISIIENNIKLTQAQIMQAQYEIAQKEKELSALEGDIRLLEIRLNRLDDTINYHQKLLAARIRQEYIESQYSIFERLISSNGLGKFITNVQYLRRVEAYDQDLLNKMAVTKDNYEDQQNLLKQKKAEVENIKKDIEQRKSRSEALRDNLKAQVASKDSLLRITKNNEARYKKLLSDAEKELKQIQSAANVVIREGNGVKVKKGEVVGTMGNSGFSSGAHLHFGVYKYNKDDFSTKGSWSWYYSSYVDPLDVLNSKSVYWDTGCSRDPKGYEKVGNGDWDWDWPMKSPRITQNFGSKTCYNWMYGGKPHPALDMVGMGDISVRAVDDGEAYFCRNCLHDGGNGVFIFHDNGRMSLYWHLR